MTDNPIVYRSYSFTESARVKHLLDILELKYETFSSYDGPHVFIIEVNKTKKQQIKDAVKQVQEDINHKLETGELCFASTEQFKEGYDVGSKGGSN